MARNLIVNADDFGYSPGVNRGIVECHERGILTSASLMVTGHAVKEAVELAGRLPALSIGLHFDVWGEDEREFDVSDVDAVRAELSRQLATFCDLVGRGPTHVDSHRHVHREERLFPVFVELVEPLGVPLRGDGRVAFVGGFYAQWEWGVTDLDHVGVPFLRQMLVEEVGDGWTEISCHPGYVDFEAVYAKEREEEIRTLTDSSIRRAVADEGIALRSYADLPPR